MNKFEDKDWLKPLFTLALEVGELKEQRKLLEDRIAELRERMDRLESTYPYKERLRSSL